MQNKEFHVPVLLEEVLQGLQIIACGTYVDCTLGGGGHSRAILESLDPKGNLVVFDQDQQTRNNIPDDSRLIFIPHNFRHLKRFLRHHKIAHVNGILADLGVSSHQIDVPERGFSTRFDGPLDMRMDQRQSLTAAEILKTYPEEKLHSLFEQYGEVTNSRTVARAIIQQRNNTVMNNVSEFKNALYSVVMGNPNKYFAQLFQALRIEVNDEFGALKEMLGQVADVLLPGGRIVIITFHSLEDRIVKNFFKNGSFNEIETDEIYGLKQKNPFTIITKKPITATDAEIKRNPRARSAKLRIAERSIN